MLSLRSKSSVCSWISNNDPIYSTYVRTFFVFLLLSMALPTKISQNKIYKTEVINSYIMEAERRSKWSRRESERLVLTGYTMLAETTYEDKGKIYYTQNIVFLFPSQTKPNKERKRKFLKFPLFSHFPSTRYKQILLIKQILKKKEKKERKD